MVIYAVSTNSSIGQLFMAGVIPGIMLATMLGMTTWYRAWKNNYPRLPKATMLERVQAFRNASWGLFLIVIVIGGIYSGMFTPTEAAAMSAVYAFFIAVFVYRDMRLEGRAARPAVLGQHERDAALHHHQRGAVLVPDDAREYPAGDGRLDHRARASAGSRSCWWSMSCCCSPAT